MSMSCMPMDCVSCNAQILGRHYRYLWPLKYKFSSQEVLEMFSFYALRQDLLVLCSESLFEWSFYLLLICHLVFNFETWSKAPAPKCTFLICFSEISDQLLQMSVDVCSVGLQKFSMSTGTFFFLSPCVMIVIVFYFSSFVNMFLALWSKSWWSLGAWHSADL